MARLTRDCVITEKIDGTNAQIHICTTVEAAVLGGMQLLQKIARTRGIGADVVMFAGSRTRYITPNDDNFGFAKWVKEHADELWALGEGRHYGEWWGSGIQRGYGLTEKRFSLFNTSRWVDQSQWATEGLRGPLGEKQEYAPACCHVVPVLYRGLFGPKHADNVLDKLRAEGSMAAPGFMNPEGVVVFHTAASVMFKKTLDKDDEWKGKSKS